MIHSINIFQISLFVFPGQIFISVIMHCPCITSLVLCCLGFFNSIFSTMLPATDKCSTKGKSKFLIDAIVRLLQRLKQGGLPLLGKQPKTKWTTCLLLELRWGIVMLVDVWQPKAKASQLCNGSWAFPVFAVWLPLLFCKCSSCALGGTSAAATQGQVLPFYGAVALTNKAGVVTHCTIVGYRHDLYLVAAREHLSCENILLVVTWH